jgi:hypothetical protein
MHLVFDWQHICYLWLTCRHTYGCNMCSSSRRLVPLFAWGRLHTRASQEKRKEASRSFNSTFRYIDDVLSLNNSRFGDFVDHIYPIELEIKDTAIQIGLRHTLTYTSKLTVCSNIPAAPAKYWVYISQLIRYSRACGSYQDFWIEGCC